MYSDAGRDTLPYEGVIVSVAFFGSLRIGVQKSPQLFAWMGQPAPRNGGGVFRVDALDCMQREAECEPFSLLLRLC